MAEKLGEQVEGSFRLREFDLRVYGSDLPASRSAGTVRRMTENEESASGPAWTRRGQARRSAAAARGGRGRARGRRASAAGGPSTRTRRTSTPARPSAPLAEGGEGVEEGFELAEDDLEEAASHDENRYDPSTADFGDEESAGDADVESGEADEYEKPD